MAELLGPANAPGFLTVRPADTRVFGTDDRWFGDCSGPDANDGTEISASFLNGQLAQTRAVIRGMGVAIDNADDAMMLKAIKLAGILGATDSGASNAAVAAFDPPLTAGTLTNSRVVAVQWAQANTTTTPTLNVNGLGAKTIVNLRGGALSTRRLKPGRVDLLIYDNSGGGRWRLATSATKKRVVYSTPGVHLWTCPDGVTEVENAELWGGGASGWNATVGPLSTSPGGTDGPGGPSGGYTRKHKLSVTPGVTYTLTVGAGGIAPVIVIDTGASGGTTSFDSLLSATGGVWGGGASQTPGTGIGGDENITGGVGLAIQNQSGTAGFNGVYGYGAAAARGGTQAPPYSPGHWPGGGGGGGNLTASFGGAVPGNGAAGAIVFEYED